MHRTPSPSLTGMIRLGLDSDYGEHRLVGTPLSNKIRMRGQLVRTSCPARSLTYLYRTWLIKVVITLPLGHCQRQEPSRDRKCLWSSRKPDSLSHAPASHRAWSPRERGRGSRRHTRLIQIRAAHIVEESSRRHANLQACLCSLHHKIKTPPTVTRDHCH